MKNIILSTLVITTGVLVVNVAQADTTPFPWGMHKVKFRISKISEG